MQIDEEFKNLIPKLSDEEFKQLEENIIKEGCREPIIIWNDTIIDGHNRYEICSKHNIGFKTLEKNFDNRENAKVWIIKNQFGRRNLSSYDRGKLALQLDSLFTEKAKENQGTRTDLFQKTEKSQMEEKVEPINTTKELAEIAEISTDTMSKVKKIEKEAPKTVSKAVEDKLISINRGYEITKQLKEVPKEEKEEKGNELIDQYINKEFKKIEKETAIQKNIHNAIYKILCTDITEEDLNIWYEGLDKCYLETLENDMERAIEQYQNIKEFIKGKRKIRRIK